MKKLLLLSILLLIAEGCATRSPHPDIQSPRTISDTPASERNLEDRIALSITRRRTRDLRSLFISPEAIASMVERHVCLLRLGWDPSKTWEVPVDDQSFLDKIMRSSPFRAGYSGQMKVISRDSIIQTPIAEYTPSAATQIRVYPGDLIYVEGRGY
jgi:hypothetical protein